ncbi:hypothetical protein BDR03DRAFT_947799 [Suillus americanus]|nr:hypothetical protein BDR03DRAFT_975551 [Suillus americanus]KAG2040963.1 hypothetical protein BDR03DRAFT_947799 [Suillus americanus]
MPVSHTSSTRDEWDLFIRFFNALLCLPFVHRHRHFFVYCFFFVATTSGTQVSISFCGLLFLDSFPNSLLSFRLFTLFICLAFISYSFPLLDLHDHFTSM